ncbi:MAG: imidazoleglycerol-phosphate dehydratase HisB [Eubacterium sp.]|nr:imidazoleglycerol-phosphate dehydratase HisB [Eubacterium sp.]
MKDRKASYARTTSETDISVAINLDGTGVATVDTGIGFFDHMLNSFAKHGFFDLSVKCKGDLFIDCHHTIEDTGIVLGKALKKALGDKAGIRRYASFTMPMDDALVLSAVDLSGRPYLGFDLKLTTPQVGYFDTEMVKEFFYAVSYAAEMNIHIKQFTGENNHHLIEAAFKAFANALKEATRLDPRLGDDLLSTKGAL